MLRFPYFPTGWLQLANFWLTVIEIRRKFNLHTSLINIFSIDKIGKPKHYFKVHLFGGISRQGLTPLIIFTGTMFSGDFQNFLTASILPFIRMKFPYGHRFFNWSLKVHLNILKPLTIFRLKYKNIKLSSIVFI